MGTLVVTTFISLDGVAEAPGGGDFKYAEWSFEFDRGEDGERFKHDEALGAEALLIGRTTYEGFAAAWPNCEGELADKYNSMPKYVVSTTLTAPAWNNTRVLSGDVVTEVTKLKNEVTGEPSPKPSAKASPSRSTNATCHKSPAISAPVWPRGGETLWGWTGMDSGGWLRMRAVGWMTPWRIRTGLRTR